MSYTDPNPRGQTSSWVAVGIIALGFAIGGLGLILGPTWWLFWAGVVVAGIGGVLALYFDIFGQVEVDHTHGPAYAGRRQRARAAAEEQRDPQVDRRADDPYAQEGAPEQGPSS